MFRDLYFRLRAHYSRRRAERELDAELRFHYQQQMEKYMAAGMSREQAERHTRLAFGGFDQIKQ